MDTTVLAERHSLFHKHAGDAFVDANLTYPIALRGFLASDTQCSMWHDAQTIQTDRFIALETAAVGPIGDAGQG